LSAEAKDPASSKNQLYRQTIKREYPEVWAGLTPDQQANLTIEQAAGLSESLKVNNEQRAESRAVAKDERAGQRRLREIQETGRQQRLSQGNAAGLARRQNEQAGASSGDSAYEGTKQALAQQFGGEEHVPAPFKAQLENARSLPKPVDKLKAYSSLLAASQDPKRGGNPIGSDQVEEGFEIVDPVAAQKSSVAEGGREKLRLAMQGSLTMEKALDRMVQIREKLGSDFLGTDPRVGEYKLLRGKGLGAVTDVIHSGVLNEKEYERYKEYFPDLTPGTADVVNFLTKRDPTHAKLVGAKDFFRGEIAAGLRVRGYARKAPALIRLKDGSDIPDEPGAREWAHTEGLL
jgi:hypothetical protein